jgi:hypothetical protein
MKSFENAYWAGCYFPNVGKGDSVLERRLVTVLFINGRVIGMAKNYRN